MPITITQSAPELTLCGARGACIISTIRMPDHPRDTLLKWIIAFKAFKSVSLAALGVTLLVTRNADATDFVWRAVMTLHLPVTSHFVQRLLAFAANLTVQRRVAMAVAAFGYSVLLGTEGVGLHYRKPWARWFTIIATASLIPLEVYECLRELHAGRIVILIINVLVLIYLVRRKEIFE